MTTDDDPKLEAEAYNAKFHLQRSHLGPNSHVVQRANPRVSRYVLEHPLTSAKVGLRALFAELLPLRSLYPYDCARCGRRRTTHPAVHCSLCSFLGHFHR